MDITEMSTDAADHTDEFVSGLELNKSKRKAEAVELWRQMESSGVVDDAVLALDFVHFGTSEDNAKALSSQLPEHYNTTLVPADSEDIYLVKGTARPEGITLSEEQHIAWVEFMSDVAQSYACVFSVWSLEAPKPKMSFSSEDIESAC